MQHSAWFASLLIVTGCVSDPEPAAPFAQLARTRTVVPGATCAFGGTAVEVGADRDRDGFLEDAEVEHATTVCDVAPATLVRVDAEPAGDHCAAGGQRVLTGPDQDRNGTLDEDEVTTTTYVCTAAEIFHGDFTSTMWADPAAVAALRDARVVTGSIFVDTTDPVVLPRLELVGGQLAVIGAGTPMVFEAPALAQVGGDLLFRDAGFTGEVALPALVRVGGSLTVLDRSFDAGADHAFAADALVEVGGSVLLQAHIASVGLHALRTVGGRLTVDDLPITELALPALSQVGEHLLISRDYQLATLDLRGLYTVGGELDISNALHVATIDLPALTSTGGLHFQILNASQVRLPVLAAVHGPLALISISQLAELTLPALGTVDDTLTLEQSSKLVQIALPALESVGAHAAPLTAPWSLLVSGKALAELALPRLARAPAGVHVSGSPALATLTMPALTETRDLTIGNDPALTTIALPALTSAGTISVDATALTELALPQLTTVSARLSLTRTQLADLHGLSSATAIADLVVDHNPALTSLTGLDQLTAISGKLTLSANPLLSSLTALAHLATVGGAITITDDPALSSDEIAALLQRLGR